MKLLIVPILLLGLTSCQTAKAPDPFDAAMAFAMASALTPTGQPPQGFIQALQPPVQVVVKEEVK